MWKLPRTWARITGHTYMPKRGDIVILNATAEVRGECNVDQGNQLIKRVVGLPGDRVVVAGGVLTIYNKQHPDGFVPDRSLPYHSHITEVTNQDVTVTVGAQQVFVAGDNRQNSCDSRYFGPIDADQIVGKMMVRVLPANEIEIF